MKTLLSSLFAIAFLLLFSFSLNAQPPKAQLVFAGDSESVTYTSEVMSIISNKCYGCHSPNSRNDKAKEKLIWKDVQSMDPVDAVGILEEMHDVLEEGSMPPEKMLEKYPNMKLTDDEVATLKAWVEAAQSKLMDE